MIWLLLFSSHLLASCQDQFKAQIIHYNGITLLCIESDGQTSTSTRYELELLRNKDGQVLLCNPSLLNLEPFTTSTTTTPTTYTSCYCHSEENCPHAYAFPRQDYSDLTSLADGGWVCISEDGSAFTGTYENGLKTKFGVSLHNTTSGWRIETGNWREGELEQGETVSLNYSDMTITYEKNVVYKVDINTEQLQCRGPGIDFDEKHCKTPNSKMFFNRRQMNSKRGMGTYTGSLEWCWHSRDFVRQGYGHFVQEKNFVGNEDNYYGLWNENFKYGFGYEKLGYRNSYVGNFLYGEKHGGGIEFSYTSKYRTFQIGHWDYGQATGPAIVVYPDKGIFIGKLYDGHNEGYGVYIRPTGVHASFDALDN